MKKSILLLSLALTITSGAFAASPALAEFSSQSGSVKGTSTITAGLNLNAGGAEVKCGAAGITDGWTIQTAGGASTTKGPHQSNAFKWQTAEEDGKCITEIAGLKLKATVKPCNLELEQIGTSTTEVHGGVATECIVKAAGCEIKVPVGSGTKNLAQSTIKNTNNGTTQIFVFSVTHVTVTLTGGICPTTGTISSATYSITLIAFLEILI